MAMQYLERELTRMGEKDLANIVAGVRGKLGKDVALPETAAKGEILQEIPTVEQLVFRKKFTPEEKTSIDAQGGLIYALTGLTIHAQIEAQRAKNKPSLIYLCPEEDGLLAVPSRQIEVAIFPAPAEFFVPGSFNQNVAIQERMAAEDAKSLGLPNVTQIVPNETSTLTEVIFQHLKATGKWLFGQEYAAAQGLNYVFARTKNPKNYAGSYGANVGMSSPENGVAVFDLDRGDNYPTVGAVRMVVPIEVK